MNPEWIEPGDGMGRQIDLTGMRLSAQSSENLLLDGITTITPRLRYLAFRAWVIWRYWHGRQPDRWKTFIEFAARQEAALALGLAANDYRGTTIVGISEARKLIEGGKSRLPITRLTAQTATGIYATSSDSLALSDWTDFGTPKLSTTGNDLAELIEKSVATTKYARRIARNQNTDEGTASELIEFSEAFDPDTFAAKEQNILIDAMFARTADQPASFARRATYGLLLDLSKSKPDLDSSGFFSSVADRTSRFNARFNDISDAWAQYCLRDLLAAAYESALWSAIEALRNRRLKKETSSDPNDVLADAVNQPENDQLLKMLGFGLSSKMTVKELRSALKSKCAHDVAERSGLRRWSRGLTETEIIAATFEMPSAGPAALVVSWCLAAHRVADAQQIGLDDRHHNVGLRRDILPLLESHAALPVRALMTTLLHRASMQHLRIAWERMAADPTRNISMFSVDEGQWLFFRPYKFTRMNSRINQAMNWLGSLNLVGKQGTTPSGLQLLKEILADDVRPSQ
jgi:hypothetical protein